MMGLLAFLRQNLEQLLITVIVMAAVVLMLWNFRRRRCPKCGERAVRRRQSCGYCRLETSCEGAYICENCQASFTNLKELRKAAGGDPPTDSDTAE